MNNSTSQRIISQPVGQRTSSTSNFQRRNDIKILYGINNSNNSSSNIPINTNVTSPVNGLQTVGQTNNYQNFISQSFNQAGQSFSQPIVIGQINNQQLDQNINQFSVNKQIEQTINQQYGQVISQPYIQQNNQNFGLSVNQINQPFIQQNIQSINQPFIQQSGQLINQSSGQIVNDSINKK